MKACRLLKANQEKILLRWERDSVQQLENAQELSRAAIRDHLPQVLSALCEVLESGVFKRPEELSKTHGRQRSWVTDYSLTEVMREYSILKNVIYDELVANQIESFLEIRLIDRFFDSASSIATLEFVTQREHELNRITDSLVSMNQELETFAAVAAHDLRSPTSTILGYANLISEEGTTDAGIATQAVTTIQRTAARMLELIDQLLEYSKLGKEHLAREVFPLKRVALEAVDNLAIQVQQAQARIDVGHLPDYNGDAILFRQVFQNLISNSLKFRAKDRGCEIKISAQMDQGHLLIRIQDNGSGFDPNLHEQIFQPFKRGTNRLDTQGSGLGLATVKKIIELHGGTITCRGELNQGAEFVIDLPLRETN